MRHTATYALQHTAVAAQHTAVAAQHTAVAAQHTAVAAQHTELQCVAVNHPSHARKVPKQNIHTKKSSNIHVTRYVTCHGVGLS